MVWLFKKYFVCFFLELRNDQLMLEIINIASNTFWLETSTNSCPVLCFDLMLGWGFEEEGEKANVCLGCRKSGQIWPSQNNSSGYVQREYFLLLHFICLIVVEINHVSSYINFLIALFFGSPLYFITTQEKTSRVQRQVSQTEMGYTG